MRIRVLHFAAAREAAGCSEEEVELPEGAALSALERALVERHPALGRVVGRCRFAVDQEFADRDLALRDGAEVALVPPVAGGAGPVVRLQENPPSLDEAIASVQGPDAGGICCFVGIVRRESRGQEVVRLDYEAFGPMAEKKLREIGGECADRWPGTRVSVIHRTGALVVGDVAVVIAAAAPHRAQAFDACRHAIERLKQDVPIWKKELTADGAQWVGLGP